AARWLAGRSDRPLDDLLAAFANRAASGTEVSELLRELAESLRRTWRLSAVEVWTGSGDGLTRTVAVPDRPVPVARLGVAGRLGVGGVTRLRRVGLAGPGWVRTWLPELLAGRDPSQLRLAPAVHGDTVIALIIIERPADAGRFGTDTERALIEVARRLAV